MWCAGRARGKPELVKVGEVVFNAMGERGKKLRRVSLRRDLTKLWDGSAHCHSSLAVEGRTFYQSEKIRKAEKKRIVGKGWNNFSCYSNGHCCKQAIQGPKKKRKGKGTTIYDAQFWEKKKKRGTENSGIKQAPAKFEVWGRI